MSRLFGRRSALLETCIRMAAATRSHYAEHLRRRQSARACRSPPCPPCSTTARSSAPTLKARVQAAVGALGYQPNLLARSLAKQRTQTLGMIVARHRQPVLPRGRPRRRGRRPRGRLHAADRQQRQRRPEEKRSTCGCSWRSGWTASSSPKRRGACRRELPARLREGRRAGRAARAHGRRVRDRRRRARRQRAPPTRA